MSPLSFLVEANLILILFFGIYRLLLIKPFNLQITRFYLVSTLILSVVVPCLHFDVYRQSDEILAVVPLREMIVTGSDKALHHLLIYKLLFYGIVGGWLFYGFRFARQLFVLFRVAKFGKTLKMKRMMIVESSFKSNFSFFNYIFIAADMDDHQRETILLHEQGHIYQWHSLDKVLAELFTVFFWFNPVTRMYRKAITEVHEYLADAYVLRHGVNKIRYQQSLLSQMFGSDSFQFIHYFNHSLLKSRILMMTKNRSKKGGRIRFFIASTMVMAVIFAFASESSTGEITSGKISLNPVNKGFSGEQKKIAGDSVQKDSAYVLVDEMPKFKGQAPGTFQKFVAENLVYPETAKKNNIQGKVYIQFMVDPSGSVKNVKVIRSSGNRELDEEACRVVKSSPGWTPGKLKGKNVSVMFTFPVQFAMK